jgi:hypothetical protein
MFGMGSQELLLILVIVLVLFGGSKLAREVHEGVQEGDWGGTRSGADTETATRRSHDPGAGVRVLQESP